MARYVTGTIAQLQGKLILNGVALGQPELSVMTRVFAGGAFKQVGAIRKDGERGRPAIVWQVDTDSPAFFEVASVDGGLVASDEDSSPVPVAATAATG